MLRVNNLRRFVAMPVMAKRALSADVLSKYGIVPAAATKVFRNLSYDDIYAQGEWRTQLHPIDCPGVLNCSNRHHVCCRGRGGRDCGELRNCDRRHRCDTAIPLLTLTSSFMLFNTIMSFIYLQENSLGVPPKISTLLSPSLQVTRSGGGLLIVP
jgi:hypothetical protein